MKVLKSLRSVFVASAIVVGGTWVTAPAPASAQLSPGYFLTCNYLVDPIGCLHQLLDSFTSFGATSPQSASAPDAGLAPSTGLPATAPQFGVSAPTFDGDTSAPTAPLVPGVPSIESFFSGIASESEKSSSPVSSTDLAMLLGVGLAAVAARTAIIRRTRLATTA